MRINVNNVLKVEELLHQVNDKAHKHVFKSHAEIKDIAEDAENKLRHILNVKDLSGARVEAQSGRDLPVSYKYGPIRNTVVLERGSKDWFIIELSRDTEWIQVPSARVSITKAQRERALDLFADTLASQYGQVRESTSSTG